MRARGYRSTPEAVNTSEDPSKMAREEEARRHSKRLRTALWIVVALLFITGIAIWRFNMLAMPADRTKATYSKFVVEQDDDDHAVAEKLSDKGMINSASDFMLLLKLTNSGGFKPGTYFLSPSMDKREIIRTLEKGLTTSEGFTIPAGYTVRQIARAMDRDGLADRDRFLEAAADPALLSIDILQEGLDEHPEISGTDIVEGFLFPADYTLNSDADETMMIIMMIDAFNNFYNEDYRARADELGMDARDVLCIASVIEKETTIDSERAKISAVLHNRYNMGLASEDEVYTVPLCNPGRESIIAALYPEETEDTHYVLSAKLDGTHVFTSDDSEYAQLLADYAAAVAESEQEKAVEKAAESMQDQ